MQGVQEIIALVPFIMLLIEIILFAFYFKLDKRQRFIIFPMKDKIWKMARISWRLSVNNDF